ncbi:MAG: stage II sporulation protein D [Eubacteriales bacterium]|nr:stage II sporulation protein D [Eubacteriales bacterium]
MQSILKDILTALLMGAVVPGVMLNAAALVMDRPPVETRETTQATIPVPSDPMVLRREDGSTEEVDREAYLLGVVLAEMPASFEEEALKAQAVAARTYTQKARTTGGKHGDGSLCRDAACCQAYMDPEEYLSRGGALSDLARVRTAVEATRGQVLTYEGELIEATYFSCSGGSTEDAAAVWGTEFPYLQAVQSPGEEGAAHFTDTVRFTDAEFAQALGADLPEGEDWFGEVRYTDGGGVKSMEIAGTTYPGTRLRSLLGLRSTAFTLEAADGEIVITTRGFGHRVGMSQYGADAMAATGSTYREILAHYYPGTALSEIP